ncbi:MAG: nuclear transport factor 2 family protein [Saprospiraceae bacterium]
MKGLTLTICLFLSTQFIFAQSEIELINETLMEYIEGSTNGKPELLKKAFHPELNLYSVDKKKELSVWSGKDYILDTKEGKATGETGKIISIDFENNAAVAKVEISHPKSTSPYVDYFMLLKIDNKWTIIHKMYTKRIR